VLKALGSLPPSVRGEPTTIVLVSTTGFTMEARELADRRSDRTVVFAEPNGAGGWRIIGPAPVKGLLDLLDPGADADKRRRVREQIDAAKMDLLGEDDPPPLDAPEAFGIYAISAAGRTGLDTLLAAWWSRLLAMRTSVIRAQDEVALP
jgi:hypothetical protein